MLSEELKKQIENDIKNNKIVIFMKGTLDVPQCGFSMRTAQILQSYGASLKAYDVLADEEIRQGIKEFTNWPTIPQVFINGEFVGGCDIVTELHNNGDLKKMLGNQEDRG